ncbi:MAG: F0F1 ATP synthase subunit B family protein [Deltaproteobacteria bacterium]
MTTLEIISIAATLASEGGAFNWGYVAKHTINLAILLGILVYFLREPVSKFLSDRRAMLSKQIDDAEQAIAEAKRNYQIYSEKLNKMDDEIKSLRDSIRRDGQTEREHLLKQAEASSQKIAQEAAETIKLETLRAKQEIQSEVASSALAIAEEMITKSLKEADQARLMDNFIKAVEEGEKWEQSQH